MDAARPRVAILGGGYAGMAAAVTLAERSVPVTVYEAAGQLGGRARRVEHRGATFDNGLHILIGAYRETLRLLRLVGADVDRVLMRLPLDWRMGRDFRLRALPLPAPLNLAGGLLTARGAGLAARWSAARFIRALEQQRFRLSHDTSVASLLETHRQHRAMKERLWHPLCAAALNTPPETASAQVFANVLRDSFGGERGASDLLLARCDLSTLFPDPAARHVRSRGGEVLTGCTVTAVSGEAGRYTVQSQGEPRDFTHVICALSPHRLHTVIGGLPALEPVARIVSRFEYQPIYSVYLQYPRRPALPAPMLGLTGGLGHWVFDREAICGEPGRLAVVISAQGAHQQLTQDELARECHRALVSEWGPFPEPSWSQVIAEKRATFACTPHLERPAMRTGLDGFLLAGDYVAGDYPATIEAAVRSGVAAANAVLE